MELPDRHEPSQLADFTGVGVWEWENREPSSLPPSTRTFDEISEVLDNSVEHRAK